MGDSVWKVMVEVQVSRRRREAVVEAPQRCPRQATLHSIRERLLDDHYAILTAGEY